MDFKALGGAPTVRGAVRGAVRARHHCEPLKIDGFRRARGCDIPSILRRRSAAREQHDQARTEHVDALDRSQKVDPVADP